MSVPVVFAAYKLKIPVVLHESDYTPGLANRLCIPRAQKVCAAFSSTLKSIPEGKGVYTGLPIRAELLKGSKDNALKMCGFSGKKPVLLVMGGSEITSYSIHYTKLYDRCTRTTDRETRGHV